VSRLGEEFRQEEAIRPEVEDVVWDLNVREVTTSGMTGGVG